MISVFIKIVGLGVNILLWEARGKPAAYIATGVLYYKCDPHSELFA